VLPALESVSGIRLIRALPAAIEQTDVNGAVSTSGYTRPAEVIFVPLELRDISRSNEVEREMFELAPSFHEQPIMPVLASETKK
jgi:hypothetical protein